MLFRFRPELISLEERATPDAGSPVAPDGAPVNPTTPAQTTPPPANPVPVVPPVDPYGTP